VIKKYKDVDIEAVACVHNLQYSSVQFSTAHHAYSSWLSTRKCTSTTRWQILRWYDNHLQLGQLMSWCNVNGDVVTREEISFNIRNKKSD